MSDPRLEQFARAQLEYQRDVSRVLHDALKGKFKLFRGRDASGGEIPVQRVRLGFDELSIRFHDAAVRAIVQQWCAAQPRTALSFLSSPSSPRDPWWKSMNASSTVYSLHELVHESPDDCGDRRYAWGGLHYLVASSCQRDEFFSMVVLFLQSGEALPTAGPREVSGFDMWTPQTRGQWEALNREWTAMFRSALADPASALCMFHLKMSRCAAGPPRCPYAHIGARESPPRAAPPGNPVAWSGYQPAPGHGIMAPRSSSASRPASGRAPSPTRAPATRSSWRPDPVEIARVRAAAMQSRREFAREPQLPPGTRLAMVGGARPLDAVVLRWNAPGRGRPSDPTAKDLATYTLRSLAAYESYDMAARMAGAAESWDEACEDVHDPKSWKILGTPHADPPSSAGGGSLFSAATGEVLPGHGVAGEQGDATVGPSGGDASVGPSCGDASVGPSGGDASVGVSAPDPRGRNSGSTSRGRKGRGSLGPGGPPYPRTWELCLQGPEWASTVLDEARLMRCYLHARELCHECGQDHRPLNDLQRRSNAGEAWSDGDAAEAVRHNERAQEVEHAAMVQQALDEGVSRVVLGTPEAQRLYEESAGYREELRERLISATREAVRERRRQQCGDPPSGGASRSEEQSMTEAASFKDNGNALLKKKRYHEAFKAYSEGISAIQRPLGEGAGGSTATPSGSVEKQALLAALFANRAQSSIHLADLAVTAAAGMLHLSKAQSDYMVLWSNPNFSHDRLPSALVKKVLFRKELCDRRLQELQMSLDAEEEAQQRQGAAEEEAQHQRAVEEEAQRQRAAEEEAQRQRAAEEEAQRQRAAEVEAQQQQQGQQNRTLESETMGCRGEEADAQAAGAASEPEVEEEEGGLVVSGKKLREDTGAANAEDDESHCPVCLEAWLGQLSDKPVVALRCPGGFHAICLECFQAHRMQSNYSRVYEYSPDAQSEFTPVFKCCTCNREVSEEAERSIAAQMLAQIRFEDEARADNLEDTAFRLYMEDSPDVVHNLLLHHCGDLTLAENALRDMAAVRVVRPNAPDLRLEREASQLTSEQKEANFQKARWKQKELGQELARLKQMAGTAQGGAVAITEDQIRACENRYAMASEEARRRVLQLNNPAADASAAGRAPSDAIHGLHTLDFHGQKVKDVEKLIAESVIPLIQVLKRMAIITGRGRNNATGTCPLKIAVDKAITKNPMLRKEIVEGNPGALIIVLRE
ncbi:hypothetical protein CYMTET_50087 [Cymbomonas tetramitiformis]|uniref:C3H1-type domain-containing protein n=1 Tax=Cymbomonas tetramitiformis TaxID=36881 RepID=A0AAE0BNY3_9CHLO|nr:hypothetical protein CYMTET_50087 [Cymbomonas tetramitiformis]